MKIVESVAPFFKALQKLRGYCVSTGAFVKRHDNWHEPCNDSSAGGGTSYRRLSRGRCLWLMFPSCPNVFADVRCRGPRCRSMSYIFHDEDYTIKGK